MSKMIDLTGQKFGRWTVINRAANSALGQTRWHCICSCGNKGIVQSTSLKREGGGSCGCRSLEALVARSTKHNHATNGITPTYHSWAGMKARCLNPLHRAYRDYGGRGITVCDRWLSFDNFLADMGEKPTGLSIDRIDLNGSYFPGNCRWATTSQQSRNKRNNRIITSEGESRTIAEWSELLSIHPATISDRLQQGRSDAEAISKTKLRSRRLTTGRNRR